MYHKRQRLQDYRKRIVSVVVVLITFVLFTLYHWMNEVRKTAHIMPQNDKLSIENLIVKTEVNVRELNKISEQTGVQGDVIKEMLRYRQGEKILEIQRAYYVPVEWVSIRTTPLTVCEYVVNEQGEYTKGTDIVDLRNGDILITKNSRFLGWRNGHAGLVVDAGKGLVLEAVMLGTNTKLCSVRGWENYPSFQVLRLKEEFRDSFSIEEVVAFAKQNLIDIPYQLHAGIWSKLSNILGLKHAEIQKGQVRDMCEGKLTEISEAALSGTHCAHVIWYAYQQVGIDLDSDGGIFVTPYDIQNSPYLEVIQSYGY